MQSEGVFELKIVLLFNVIVKFKSFGYCTG